MENPINKIYVSPAEYSYIVDLTPIEKFKYLLEKFDIESNKDLNLTQFFTDLAESYTEEDIDNLPRSGSQLSFNEHEESDDPDRVDVMIDDEHILIESNSLKSLRVIVKNLFESGYVLRRDQGVETMFRKSKVTKYLRVYKIIGIVNLMCLN
jgi:hypothetical protein